MGVHRAARRRRSSYSGPAATAAVLLVVMGVLSATPAAAATGTYVRLAQLSADMAGAELVVTSVSNPQRSVVIPGVGYGQLSEYRRVEPGDYLIGLRPAGSGGTPVVSTPLTAAAGAAYTLAAVGGTDLGVKVLADDLTPPAAGQSRVRVIHAAASPAQLDVRGPAGEPFAMALPRGESSAYRSVPAGRLVLMVSAALSPSTDLPINFGANQVVTVVLTGGDGAVAATVRVDAEGPAALPPGPVNAGFGGGPGSRPGGLAAMVAFLALAVAAAGLSAHLAHRSRGARHRPC